MVPRSASMVSTLILLLNFTFWCICPPGFAASSDSPVKPEETASTPQKETEQPPTPPENTKQAPPSPALDGESESKKEEENKPDGTGETLKPASPLTAPMQARPFNTQQRAKKIITPTEVENLKERVKSRRRVKNPKNKQENDANILDQIRSSRHNRDKDRFDLDYDPKPSEPQVNSEVETSTPFYKHWIFWTVLGVAAFGGTMIYLKYGYEKGSDSMNLNISRRNP